MDSMLEILNECLEDSNLETVSKAELRKNYLAKVGLAKLPKEDKELFASAVNTAYLNYISSKTKANGDNTKNLESSDSEIKENSDDKKIINSDSEEDITPANLNADQFGNGLDDIQMEHSSESGEKSLASFKNKATKSSPNGIKKQRSKRTITSSSEDEIIQVKPTKRSKVLKTRKSSDSETERIKSEKEENVSKTRLKKYIMESSDSEDEPLVSFKKKSNSYNESLNSMAKSDDSEDEPVISLTKMKTSCINDSTIHSSDSENEAFTKFQKSNDSLQSNGKINKFKAKKKMNQPDFDMESKNSFSDSEDEPLTKYGKCDKSILVDKASNLVTKKLNSSNKSFKSIESTSGSEEEPILTFTKKKSNSLNKSCASKHSSSESENEPLTKYSKNKASNSFDSDEESLTTLTKKSKSVNGSLKSIKNSSDSDDEPLSNLSNKKTDDSSDSEKEPDKKIVAVEVTYLNKSVTGSSKTKDQILKKKKSLDSDDDIINKNKEKSFDKQKNHLSSDSSDDEPLNKLSVKKLDEKQKDSGSGSSSFVDENEEHADKKNKTSKQKEANDSGKHQRKRPSASENKIEHLKKYLRVAGIRISNYNKLFENCKTMKSKCEKLMSLLEKEGLKGRPTLEKCKKLRIKIETKKEIAELDMSNILKVGGGRPKRSVCSDATNCKPKEENPTPIKKFSRLQDIIDSEESD